MSGHGGPDDGTGWPDFVAARWGSLEAVALAATLEADAARRLTADALHDLRRRWARVAEDGSPTAAARAALLERVATLRTGEGPGRGRPERPGGADPDIRAAVADEDSAVPAALLDALARESPLVRAATTAALLWDLGPTEVAALLPRKAAATLAGAGPVRSRLLAAHREARAVDGLGPADDRFDDDLAEVVHRLAEAPGDPPDPEGLVDAGSSRPGRRLAVVGIGGAAAAGLAGWAVLGRDGRDTPSARAAATLPPLPPPDSPVWLATDEWPARGRLATDPGVRQLVARAGVGARLLFADEVNGLRIVGATDPSMDFGPDETAVRWWRGPAATRAIELVALSSSYQMISVQPHHVALGTRLPSGDSLVLVLGRPSAPDAEVSLLVRPTRRGTIERTWDGVPVRDGIGSLVVPGRLGTAVRLRFDSYDGGLPTVDEDQTVNGAVDGLGLVADVTRATGVARDRLEVSVDERDMPSDVRIGGSTGIAARTTVVRLPSGAVVRSVELADQDRTNVYGGSDLQVVPADELDRPVVVPFFDDTGSRERQIVLVDPAARRVRLEAAVYSTARPSTVPVRDGVAVVDLGGQPELVTGDYLVRVTGAGGRTLYDGPASRGVSLLDLYPDMFF